MRENYIIHLICGSTVKVVYGRMMTFVFILTGVVFLFMSATSFFDIRIIVPAAGFLVLMDIVLGITSYLLLCKEKLSIN